LDLHGLSRLTLTKSSLVIGPLSDIPPVKSEQYVFTPDPCLLGRAIIVYRLEPDSSCEKSHCRLGNETNVGFLPWPCGNGRKSIGLELICSHDSAFLARCLTV